MTKYNATVAALESGRTRTDRQPQAKIRFEGAEAWFNSITVPNGEGWVLDEELTALLLNSTQRDLLLEFISSRGTFSSSFVSELAEQLRPDPLPPFMAEPPHEDAETHAAHEAMKDGLTDWERDLAHAEAANQ